MTELGAERPTRLSVVGAAHEVPRRIALVDDGKEISFEELATWVMQVVDVLRKRGVGERSALIGAVDTPTLVTLLALIEMETTAVVVHPRWSDRERNVFLADAGAPEVIDPATIVTKGNEETPSGPFTGLFTGKPSDPFRDLSCSPLAILRTSGTSGRPRGVALSRQAFEAAAWAHARHLGWQEGDRWWLGLTPAHVGGLSILTRCLWARRTVVVRSGLARFDPAKVLDAFERDHVTLASLVPTMLRRLLEIDRAPPPTMRAVLLGGAAAPSALVTEAISRGWPVLPTYGLTEACAQVATVPLESLEGSTSRALHLLDGMEARITRAHGPERVGRLELRGPQLLDAYLPGGSPLDPDGWLKTGDLARLDADGSLHVLGRQDDVLVTGGENVHPAAVEEALEEHPGVRSACVFGVADPEWGEAVAAALVATAEPVDDAELVRFCRARLASYSLPRRVIWVNELPVSAVGKVDRGMTVSQWAGRLRRLERSP